MKHDGRPERKMTTKTKLAAITAVVVAAGMVGAPVASAVTATSGGLTFDGEADLPIFPCPTPGDFCEGGTFHANFTGDLTGTWNNQPYTVTWATVDSPLEGDFKYWELECSEAGGLLAGRAEGSGSALVPAGSIGGQWYVPGDLFPRQPSKMWMEFDFLWIRVANGASIQLNNLQMDVTVPGVGNVSVVDGGTVARAAAHFVPHGGGAHVPTCEDPSHDLTGDFTGEAALGDL